MANYNSSFTGAQIDNGISVAREGSWQNVALISSNSRSTSSYAGKGSFYEVEANCVISGFSLLAYDTGSLQGFALKMSSNDPTSATITEVLASSGVVSEPAFSTSLLPVGVSFSFATPASLSDGDYLGLCAFVTTGTGTTSANVSFPNHSGSSHPINTEFLTTIGSVRFDDGIASAVTTGWASNGLTTANPVVTAVKIRSA